MDTSYPGSETARAQRAREEATQVALETVAEGGPLAGVLEFLCRTMEDESVDRVIACIHPLNEDATMFRDTAAPSLDKRYREAVDGMRVSSMTGPCCYAATTRQTVVVPAVAADPKWGKFQEFAEPLGIRSCWSTPIFSHEGKVLGTFAHYYFEARDPSPRDERMVELLTRAAAVAIERSRAEAALRELNATLEQRVQAAETRERLQTWNVSQDLLVIAGVDGTYLSVNPAWTATLGWSEADVLGKSSQWLLHPDDRESTRAELDHLAKGHKTWRFENRLRAKDGSYHWIAWTAAPDSERIYSMGRDMTESKRAEEALRQAQAELAHVARLTTLGELTASIAHEINQPLGAMITSAHACLRWLAAQNLARAQQSAMRIVADGQRAADTITRIRALAQKAPPHKDWLDLNATIRDVLALARSEVHRHRVVVEMHLAEHVPVVRADRIQLQQVLLNLLINALEALSGVGDGPRELVVQSDTDAAQDVLVTVRDSGPGLDPQGLDRLFDAFYTTKPHGLGLGLAISRSIIAAHGGRLWASANVPHGAVFQFTVPRGSEERG
jgi:PAS domain S-box-containing protein